MAGETITVAELLALDRRLRAWTRPLVVPPVVYARMRAAGFNMEGVVVNEPLPLYQPRWRPGGGDA